MNWRAMRWMFRRAVAADTPAPNGTLPPTPSPSRSGAGVAAAVEVLLEVAHDVVVVPAAGEDVDETEELRLEVALGHGPAQELVAPP